MRSINVSSLNPPWSRDKPCTQCPEPHRVSHVNRSVLQKLEKVFPVTIGPDHVDFPCVLKEFHAVHIAKQCDEKAPLQQRYALLIESELQMCPFLQHGHRGGGTAGPAGSGPDDPAGPFGTYGITAGSGMYGSAGSAGGGVPVGTDGSSGTSDIAAGSGSSGSIGPACGGVPVGSAGSACVVKVTYNATSMRSHCVSSLRNRFWVPRQALGGQ